jgi:hypothetical protein
LPRALLLERAIVTLYYYGLLDQRRFEHRERCDREPSVKLNDNTPKHLPQDAEPRSDPAVVGITTSEVATDRVWPPPPKAVSTDSDVTAPLDAKTIAQMMADVDATRARSGKGHRESASSTQAERQADSQGRNGAAYDTIARPARSIEPITQPNRAVIIRNTTPMAPPVVDPANTPFPPGGGEQVRVGSRSPRVALTTVPAARRVRAVERTIKVMVGVAAILAVATVAALVAKSRRAATARVRPSVYALSSTERAATPLAQTAAATSISSASR